MDDVFNGVKTKSYFSDSQFFSGKGAGAFPTASAVLSDISALTYDYRYEYKKLNGTDLLETADNIFLKIFLRHKAIDSDIVKIYFEEISESYRNHKFGFSIGTISLEKLKEVVDIEDCSVILFEAFGNEAPYLEKLVHEELEMAAGL